jgi:2-(1,2-epoxy-1,2-dihydrophenyl)acetyl-CoA isomerase
MVQQEEVNVVRKNQHLCITLNRPEKLNALTPCMAGALRTAFADAAADNAIRAILLTGSGRGFCAGQDLNLRDPDGPDWPPDLHASVTQDYAPLINAILFHPKPVVCAVNGVAAGAGANLALACDTVLAAKDAKFIQSFSRVGLIPDLGGTWILPRLIGLARAKAMCMNAVPVDGETAERWGMIWQAIPRPELMSTAIELVEELSSGPTVALGLMKKALIDSGAQDLGEHLKKEAEYQDTAGKSADYEEGVRAFLNKRSPAFKGQ